MRVLIDTNVILDVLTKREPHFALSASFLRMCGLKVTGYITASQTTDIFYMLRKHEKDACTIKWVLKRLTDNITVLDANNDDVQNALASEMTDYEDALLAFCAKRQKIGYIITRNEADFKMSPVPALSPRQFLERFFPA
ncbi:MAG: PIN domain-containing protein [Oscillospiraceae bacterium]|jgi:predicted nucleic acid-binding protein|nr:PIN domain-containing protein [Oscillospiraceae bacterium]